MDTAVILPAPARGVAFISKQLWRVNQGLARIGIFWNVMGFLTFIKVWQGTFEHFGVGIITVFLILGVVYMVSTWLVGFWNETKQFSRQEWLHSIKVQNPEWFEMLGDVRDMKASVARIEKQLDCERNDGR